MRFALPVLVGVDRHDRFHVCAATVASPSFSGASLTEVLDDLALYFMEWVPQRGPALVERLIFCHDTQLRRVTVEQSFVLSGRVVPFRGRLSVVAQRWPGQGLYQICVPRLRDVWVPVRSLGHLASAVPSLITSLAGAGLGAGALEKAVARRDEHLEVLEIEAELPTVLSSRTPRRKRPQGKDRDAPAPSDRRGREWVAPTTLRETAVSLGHRALDQALRPAYGRDELVDRIVQELKRPGAAVMLVGPHGVGKTAVIYEVVRRMVDPHATLTERQDFWALDGNRLIAGMMFVGSWERRTESLVSELSSRDDVLVVDDLPTLVHAGRSAHSDTNVAGFLEPHLARRAFRVLGETTAERLAAVRDEAPGFFGRFRVFQVPPLDERRTMLVLQRIAREGEADRGLRIAPDALAAVLGFNRRFQSHHAQPGAGVTLLRRVIDDARPTGTDAVGRPVLDAEATRAVIQRLTGLPAFVLDPRHAHEPAEIRAWFDERVLAQPNAAETVLDVICTLQQGLSDPGRPIATLLLVGPTGVGKTETAKALAAWLFGSPQRLVRFDMSEFRSPAAVARLIGDARQPDGELTRRVAHQPFSVVLFDEIEKAHPAMFDVLLQVLGEGRLTNAVGRTTDFTSTIVMLTSNLGVAEARQSLGFAGGTASSEDAHYRKAAERFFRPEFVNRLDRVVAYRTLRREHVGALVQRLVRLLLLRRGFVQSGVLVRVDPMVVDFIIEEGFNAAFGARSLKRTLEQRFTVPLARELVARPPGALTHVEVYPVHDRLELSVSALEPRSDWHDGEPVPDDVAGLRALHAALTDAMAQLREMPQWDMVAQARSRLLAEVQDDHGEGFDELHELAGLVTGVEELDEALETMGAESLGAYRYEESVDYVVVPERNWEPAIRRPVLSEVPVAVDVRRERAKVRRLLGTYRRDVAVLRYRLCQVGLPPDPVLVRVLPETPDSGPWAVQVASSIVRAWGQWGPAEVLRRDDGDWLPAAEIAPRRSTGEALLLHGRGLRPLLEVIEGYALFTQQLGPDRVVRLARVELFESSAVPPARRLAAADAAWNEHRAARREGRAAGAGLRRLAVSLRIDERKRSPRESDVRVHLSDEIQDRGLRQLERGTEPG